MANRPDAFDFDATLRSLSETLERAPEVEKGAIQTAIDSLLFLFAQNRLQEFRDYLRSANAPADVVFPIEHEFEDMARAATWLSSQPAPRHGTLVKVAGRTHTVWRDEDGSLLLLPSFSPQELDARKKAPR